MGSTVALRCDSLERISRILATRDARLASSADLGGRREAARVQGYNGQIAVDGHRQVITAQRLTTNGANDAGLAPLVDDTIRRCGRGLRQLRLRGFGQARSEWALICTVHNLTKLVRHPSPDSKLMSSMPSPAPRPIPPLDSQLISQTGS